MSKARVYGMKSSFLPNRKADMRYRAKAFLRSKDRVDDPFRQEQAECKRWASEKKEPKNEH